MTDCVVPILRASCAWVRPACLRASWTTWATSRLSRASAMPARRTGSLPIMRSMITIASLVFRPLVAFFFMGVNSGSRLENDLGANGRPEVRVLDASLLAADHGEHDALGTVEEVEHSNLHPPRPGPQLVDPASEVSRDRTAQLVTDKAQLVDERDSTLVPPDVPSADRIPPITHLDLSLGTL